jgi:hypothetical protein
MFAVFFVVLAILTGRAFGQDIVLLDSVTVPLIENYDTACDCYPDSMVMYSYVDIGTEGQDTMYVQFGYTRFGNKAWTTTVLISDSASTLSIHPFVAHHLDPYDVNRDGRVSIVDITLIIYRLFIQ